MLIKQREYTWLVLLKQVIIQFSSFFIVKLNRIFVLIFHMCKTKSWHTYKFANSKQKKIMLFLTMPLIIFKISHSVLVLCFLSPSINLLILLIEPQSKSIPVLSKSMDHMKPDQSGLEVHVQQVQPGVPRVPGNFLRFLSLFLQQSN